jgi:uncharacterized protein with HEPN domain/DNA-binding XRE family transcriptional regulator
MTPTTAIAGRAFLGLPVSTIRYNSNVDRMTASAGTLLRRARKQSRLSQVELATRAGVSQSVISAYESGQRQPSIPALARLIEAAGFELTLELQRQPSSCAACQVPWAAGSRFELSGKPATLADIQAAIDAIRAHLQRGDLSDGLIFDAVRIHLLEIGEAVKALPDEMLATQPSIPWRQIARMRDHLAHRYFDTAHSIVQATVDEDLPELEHAIGALSRYAEGH